MGDKMACIRGKPGLQSGNKMRVLATFYGNGSNQDSSVRVTSCNLIPRPHGRGESGLGMRLQLLSVCWQSLILISSSM